MLKRPEFLILNDAPHLVLVTRDKGKVVDIAGPYQAIGEPGLTPEEFIKSFNNIAQQALDSGTPITIDDLPEHIKAQIEVEEAPKKAAKGGK